MNRLLVSGVAIAPLALTAYALTKPNAASESQAQIKQAERSAQQKNLQQAIAQVEAVPVNSPHAAIAQQLKNSWTQDLIGQAVEAHQQGDVSKALSLLPLTAANSQIQQLRTEWGLEASRVEQIQKLADRKEWQQVLSAIETIKGSALYANPTIQALLQSAISEATTPPTITAQLPSPILAERVVSPLPNLKPNLSQLPKPQLASVSPLLSNSASIPQPVVNVARAIQASGPQPASTVPLQAVAVNPLPVPALPPVAPSQTPLAVSSQLSRTTATVAIQPQRQRSTAQALLDAEAAKLQAKAPRPMPSTTADSNLAAKPRTAFFVQDDFQRVEDVINSETDQISNPALLQK